MTNFIDKEIHSLHDGSQTVTFVTPELQQYYCNSPFFCLENKPIT